MNMAFQLTKECFEVLQLIEIAVQFTWLSDAYISDFFTKKHWSKVNPKWWLLLSQLEPNELASLLNAKTWKSRHVWPLSMLAYRSIVHHFSLENMPEDSDDTDNNGSNQENRVSGEDCGQAFELEHCFRRHVKPKKQHEILHLSKAINNLSEESNCHDVLDVGAGQGHLARILAFRYGLNVTTIEAVGCHCPKAEKFDREVKTDIQKGRIHSKKQKQHRAGSQDLNFSKNTPNHVTAAIHPDISVDDFFKHISEYSDIEGSFQTIEDDVHRVVPQKQHGAHEPQSVGLTMKIKDDQSYGRLNYNTKESWTNENLDYASTSSFHKNNIQLNSKDSNFAKEQPKETKLPQNNTSTVTASNYVKQFDEETSEKPSRFIMTGLHACGNLTTTMIRMFVKSEELRGLAIVGCCYMKLSTSKEISGNEDIGYPVSNYVRTLPDHFLSYEALEMACHFIDAYHKRLLENSFILHSHCYRAALQEIIAEKSPDFKHGCIKVTIKNAENMTFKQYAEKALCRLGLDTHLNESQIRNAENRLTDWKKVVAFYTLRLSLAPLLETIVLLDRKIYLQENGLRCQLKPIFDPLLSPRNFVLLAQK